MSLFLEVFLIRSGSKKLDGRKGNFRAHKSKLTDLASPSSSSTSLERVPETGRLRFMDLSPSAERQLGVQTFNETLREYKSLILPPSHPTSKYVERVAKRIVEGGGLGKLKGSTASPMSGWGGGLFGDTGLGGGDEWERTAAAGTKKDGGEQIEWEVSSLNLAVGASFEL